MKSTFDRTSRSGPKVSLIFTRILMRQPSFMTNHLQKLQWLSCLFTTSPYPVYTVKMLMKWFEHRLLWVSTLSGEVMRVEEVFSLHWLKLLSLLVWRKTGDLSWLQVGWWSILIFVGKFCILSSLLTEASWADFGLLQFYYQDSLYCKLDDLLLVLCSDIVQMASYAPLFVNDNDQTLVSMVLSST